ncbi:MAG: hypothetical protein WBI44_08445, partial [Syntrophaceticus sp.]
MRTALYLHFPFCLQKCRYCSFNSIPLPQDDQGRLAASYIHALEMEITLYADRYRNVELSSIYFGGGTPTVFSADSLCGV